MEITLINGRTVDPLNLKPDDFDTEADALALLSFTIHVKMKRTANQFANRLMVRVEKNYD